MLSYRIMPPPPTLEKTIGERRLVFHAGVAMSPGAELDVAAVHAAATAATGGEGKADKKALQAALSDAAFRSVVAEYAPLAAITAPESRGKPLPAGFVRAA